MGLLSGWNRISRQARWCYVVMSPNVPTTQWVYKYYGGKMEKGSRSYRAVYFVSTIMLVVLGAIGVNTVYRNYIKK